MSLNFNSAHRAYADAIMLSEAYKAFGKRGPSTSRAETASYDSSKKADESARKREKGYQPSWSTATAKAINSAIEGAAKAEIRKAKRAWDRKNKGKKITSLDMDTIVQQATAAIFGVAATQDNLHEDNGGISATQNNAHDGDDGISTRRKLITGFAAFAAVSLFDTATAYAKNGAYIRTVTSGAKSYTARTAPKTVEDLGAGLRGHLRKNEPTTKLANIHTPRNTL